MNWLELIADLIRYIIPAAAAIVVVVFMMRSFYNNEQKKKLLEMKMNNSKSMLPVKMQAYERLILYLERIHPDNIVVRVNRPGMTANELYQNLISDIRAEFDHNLSQQLYISNEAWQFVKSAKDETIKLMNMARGKVEKDEKSLVLTKTIFEIAMTEDVQPVDKALYFLKQEARSLF
jgi:hypothetical protein